MQSQAENDEGASAPNRNHFAEMARNTVMPKLQRLDAAQSTGKSTPAPGETPEDRTAFFQLTDDLALSFYFQYPHGSSDVTWRALKETGFSVEELLGLATFNLHTAVHPVFTLKQLRLAPPDGAAASAVPGMGFFHYIETGDDMEASCLLVGPIWEALRPLVPGPLRIVVPNRNSCMFCGADDTLTVAMMRDIGRSTMSDSGVNGLSDRMYTIDVNGRLLEVTDP